MAPKVLPWNPCQRPMTVNFPRLFRTNSYCRANFTAFSVASEPPERRKVCFISGGAISAILWQSSTCGLLAKQWAGLKAIVSACLAMTAATRLFPWPMEVTTDDPPEPSMYFRPLVS